MKLRAALLALVLVGATGVGVGVSQATITTANLTLSTSSSYAVVSGTTLYYNAANSGSFTVTVNDTTDSSPLTVDFPDVFGDDPAAGTGTSYTYSWTTSDTDSGDKTVDLSDGGSDTADHVFTVTPDTAPTISNSAPTEVSGAADQYWQSSANTLWFRPAGSGSFTLNATASDAESGVDSVAFPDISSTSGWSGSTGGTDSAAAYASPVAYTWTSGAAAPGAKQVTATNGTGMTATATVTISADSTAPTGQSVALNGGPWYTTTSVPLTIGQGTDAGAGVDSARAVVERASATLANGACGTFRTFSAVTLSSSADTGVSGGNCYRYQYKATDNVGNVSAASTASADAKVDTTAPSAPVLRFSGFRNAASSDSVVYFRPTGGSSFTVSGASVDGESGVASYSFPAVAGFAGAGSGASRTYISSGAGGASATLSVTATNAAGLTSGAASFRLVPDGTPPTLTVRCNGRPCRATTYKNAVTVTARAADGTGSGLETIRYTTDGTDPTADRGAEYAGGLVVQSLTRLRFRAFDRAGNPSKVVRLIVRSGADRLVFAAPLRLTTSARARFLSMRVTSSHRATVSATMTGPKLKRPRRWRFIVGAGRSLVRFRLPAGLAPTGRYRLTWTVQAGTRKVSKTTFVLLRAPKKV